MESSHQAKDIVEMIFKDKVSTSFKQTINNSAKIQIIQIKNLSIAKTSCKELILIYANRIFIKYMFFVCITYFFITKKNLILTENNSIVPIHVIIYVICLNLLIKIYSYFHQSIN